jgi:hypothetical protein
MTPLAVSLRSLVGPTRIGGERRPGRHGGTGCRKRGAGAGARPAPLRRPRRLGGKRGAKGPPHGVAVITLRRPRRLGGKRGAKGPPHGAAVITLRRRRQKGRRGGRDDKIPAHGLCGPPKRGSWAVITVITRHHAVMTPNGSREQGFCLSVITVITFYWTRW